MSARARVRCLRALRRRAECALQGEPLVDGEPGDLKFRVVTVAAAAAAAAAGAPAGASSPSAPAFERRGDDLHVAARVTLTDALVGFAHSLTHLDGRAVPLTATGVTKPGDVARLKGQGMPLPGQHARFGDLFVTYSVEMPRALDDAQKASVRKLFANAF